MPPYSSPKPTLLHHRTPPPPPSPPLPHHRTPPPPPSPPLPPPPPLQPKPPSTSQTLPPSIATHHTSTSPTHQNQCSSLLLQPISAPVPTVWSILRRFDKPQTYKQFIKSCHILTPKSCSLVPGAIREVEVVSGLPAVTSRERLEILDDTSHVISFSIIGGEHRLRNYRSVTTVTDDGRGGAVVVESYVVDVPEGNTVEDTRVFVDTIIRCNLMSLKRRAEGMRVAGEWILFSDDDRW